MHLKPYGKLVKVTPTIVHLKRSNSNAFFKEFIFYIRGTFCLFDLSPLFQTPKDYEREYSRELQQKGVEASKFHGFAYDGIWVIAKTLTRVMELLRVKQRKNIFHNFTVDDREVGKMVLDVMNETNFFGVTVSSAAICYILLIR